MKKEIKAIFGNGEETMCKKVELDIASVGISESKYLKYCIFNTRSDLIDCSNDIMNKKDILKSLRFLSIRDEFSYEEKNFLIELKNEIEENLTNRTERRKIEDE